MRITSILALTVLLTGCSNTIGTKMTQGQLDQVVSGKTTSADLVELFGQPTRVVQNSDGTHMLEWGYARAGFAGMGNEIQGVSMDIDKDGTVKSFRHSGIAPTAP